MKEKLSIIIPCYNEERTISSTTEKIYSTILQLKKELIIINDGSTDNSATIIKQIKETHPEIITLHKEKNEGKGAAVQAGLRTATGTIILIQDADDEYHPKDIPKLLEPLLSKESTVVYGSRFLGKKGTLIGKGHTPYPLHYCGNKLLSLLTKVLYKQNITDMETGYKAFRKDILMNISLKANDFSIEPELTAKLIKNGARIKEVPIDYSPRTRKEGKKIRWHDGLKAALTLIKWKAKKQ